MLQKLGAGLSVSLATIVALGSGCQNTSSTPPSALGSRPAVPSQPIVKKEQKPADPNPPLIPPDPIIPVNNQKSNTGLGLPGDPPSVPPANSFGPRVIPQVTPPNNNNPASVTRQPELDIKPPVNPSDMQK